MAWSRVSLYSQYVHLNSVILIPSYFESWPELLLKSVDKSFGEVKVIIVPTSIKQMSAKEQLTLLVYCLLVGFKV